MSCCSCIGLLLKLWAYCLGLNCNLRSKFFWCDLPTELFSLGAFAPIAPKKSAPIMVPYNHDCQRHVKYWLCWDSVPCEQVTCPQSIAADTSSLGKTRTRVPAHVTPSYRVPASLNPRLRQCQWQTKNWKRHFRLFFIFSPCKKNLSVLQYIASNFRYIS